MPRLELDLVVRATGAGVVRAATAELSAAGAGFAGVSIDTRAMPPGALYFAIRGERLDGHDFVAQAEAAGAGGVIVARGRGLAAEAATKRVAIFEVDEPLLALGRLAREHRLSLPATTRVVALTGSVGKTSTKEMLASIFAAAVGEAAVHKTRGNLNNHLGVPLTILGMGPAHLFAVVEMGMSSLGEIAYLEGIARPDLALVTNVAGVHVEQLGSLPNVGRAKGEIFGGRAAAGDAIAIAPHAEPLLDEALRGVPRALRHSFGGAGADVEVRDAKLEGEGTRVELSLRGRPLSLRLPLLGVHHARNAAAAVAAAQALGIDTQAIVAGLAQVKPEKHRMQLLEVGGRRVIDDCYNASPTSVRAALDALHALAGPGRRVAILGDMLELGPDGPRAHAEIGRYAAAHADAVIGFGPLSTHTIAGARERLDAAHAMHVADPEAAAASAFAASAPGHVLLVKASRGMKLERVIDAMAGLARQEQG